MKLGIYGGSFNPPHLGHLIVIESVRDQLHFDKVLFIPSASTPNKIDPALAPAHDRLTMMQLAVSGNPSFAVSDIEARRGGISYTVDTVKALLLEYPHADISLIIGSDNMLEFASWKSPDEIISRVALIVMHRPGFDVQSSMSEYARRATFVTVPQIGISGTEIRRRVKMGRSIRYLVTPEVEEYIYRHRLYVSPSHAGTPIHHA